MHFDTKIITLAKIKYKNNNESKAINYFPINSALVAIIRSKLVL